MAKYDKSSPNAIRRRDRAKDDAWIKDFLKKTAFAALASHHEEQVFIHSNIFVYDEDTNAIYMHTANLGRTKSNVMANEKVCFSVSTMGRLLPAKEALEFSVEYAGVTVFGRASVIIDAEEAERALQMLLDKYAPHLRPGRDYRAITQDELERTAVYRIAIDAWSGKEKKAVEDFPGAFYFSED